MAHYVVFLEHAEGYDAPGLLRKHGLGMLVDEVLGPSAADAELDGVKGKLITWHDDARPERNARDGVDGKAWWGGLHGVRIGWDADNPPTPDDLMRNGRRHDAPQISSFPANLEDGNAWLVPIARQLPQRWTQNDDGMPLLAPKSKFAWYWDEVTGMIERIRKGEFAHDRPPTACFELAVKCLALNYRICPEVIYATELLAAGDAVKVIAAACEISLDFTATVEYSVIAHSELVDQKKTEHLAANAG